MVKSAISVGSFETGLREGDISGQDPTIVKSRLTARTQPQRLSEAPLSSLFMKLIITF